jgi:peptidyl-prolyl cis-trans isomerase A (cyclophilin A)
LAFSAESIRTEIRRHIRKQLSGEEVVWNFQLSDGFQGASGDEQMPGQGRSTMGTAAPRVIPGGRMPPTQILAHGKRHSDPPTGSCTCGGSHVGVSAMKRRLALLAIALLPTLALCEPAKDAENPAAPVAAKATKVRLKTSKGDIVLELNAEKAPITVENFLGYVKKKHYDGTVFHRVIDGFMIQGGGFAISDGKLVEKTSGKGIKNEGQNGLKNERGTIAMARTSDPDSATAQFFINVADNAPLNYPSNGGYAVFGKVVEGMEVVDKIKGVATGISNLTMIHPMTGEKMEAPSQDVPKENVVILAATVE